MNEHRLVVTIPNRIRHSYMRTAHSTRCPWLSDGLITTAVQLEVLGERVWSTRAVWSARGFPSLASGSDRTWSGSSSDPHPTGLSDRTGDAATSGSAVTSLDEYRRGLSTFSTALTSWHRDPTGRAAVRRLIDAGLELDRLIDSATPSVPTASTRRRLELDADPGCAHCVRIGVWSEPTGKTPTDVGGLMADPVLLCRWCREHLVEVGALPSERLLRAHHDGNQSEVRRLKSALRRTASRRNVTPC